MLTSTTTMYARRERGYQSKRSGSHFPDHPEKDSLLLSVINTTYPLSNSYLHMFLSSVASARRPNLVHIHVEASTSLSIRKTFISPRTHSLSSSSRIFPSHVSIPMAKSISSTW